MMISAHIEQHRIVIHFQVSVPLTYRVPYVYIYIRVLRCDDGDCKPAESAEMPSGWNVMLYIFDNIFKRVTPASLRSRLLDVTTVRKSNYVQYTDYFFRKRQLIK